MKIKTLIDNLNATVTCLSDEEKEISTGYAGDFLSFVMGKAPTDSAWFTVMNNVNVAAVATLADIGCIVLCEGAQADAQLRDKVVAQGKNLICTQLSIFDAVKKSGL